MNERLFLKGQRLITPAGEVEVVDSTGDNIDVKLDNGGTRTFPSEDLQNNTSASRPAIFVFKRNYPYPDRRIAAKSFD